MRTARRNRPTTAPELPAPALRVALSDRRTIRLAVVGIALATSVSVGFALASPARAVSDAQIVGTINAERRANGLPPVREDARLSAGCAAYDNYRRLNGGVEDGFTPGDEQSLKPGYSTSGARASRDSLLNAGDRPADSWSNGDVFDDAPGHLFQLMNPDLDVIGVDQLEIYLGPFLGTAYISCIDTRSAGPRPRPRKPRLYTYIGRDGTAPVEPSYREGPRVPGALIFAYFDAPAQTSVTLRSLTLQYPDGTVRKPSYVLLVGGLRDGRGASKARTSKRETSQFASPHPSAVIEVGPPEPAGPYKLKTGYENRQPGHHAVRSTTVPFSAAVSWKEGH
jgi:uncharacterized protein YkwD